MSIDNLVTPERILPIGTLRTGMGDVELYYVEETNEIVRPYVFGGFLPPKIRCIAPEMYKPTKNGYLVFDPKENMNPMRAPR